MRRDATWNVPFAIGVADDVAKLYVYEPLADLPVAASQTLAEHLAQGDPRLKDGISTVSVEWNTSTRLDDQERAVKLRYYHSPRSFEILPCRIDRRAARVAVAGWIAAEATNHCRG